MTRGKKRLLTIWLLSIAIVVTLARVDSIVSGWGPLDRFLSFSSSAATLVMVVTSILVLVAFARFVLRKLFWRVGSRLALSYTLIGVLPFVLFAILLVVIGYIGVGVLSQASFRAERRSDLSRLDYANVEYALTGELPPDLPPELEVYDSRAGSSDELPEWLRRGSFLGVLIRDEAPVITSAKLYQLDGRERTVTLVVPLDTRYVEYFEARSGIEFIHTLARREGTDAYSFESDGEIDDGLLGKYVWDALGLRAVFWADSTPELINWSSGDEGSEVLLFAIRNPYSNLFNFYLGSSRYLDILLAVILGLSLTLLVVYGLATLLATGLIFSITRAINRIEKGTNAVERGDFSYRINMRRRNQLGDLAQSFDRMTSSISSLLEGVAEKERLQSEIAIAADIQQNLLPKRGPEFEGIAFSAHFEPTASIGGDYYDVFHLDHRRFALAIGDVSGHGLSTGLVMAMVKAAITTLVDEGADESSLFRRLNELVFDSTEKRAFMTLGFTIFDLELGTIRHTNAGHLFPYVLRKGEPPRAIEAPSLPLGVRPKIQSKTVELDLEDDDCIVYLSDGIIEALDSDQNPFGFDRLEEILATMVADDPDRIKARVLEAVREHSGGSAADDDRTIMIVKFERRVRASVPIETTALKSECETA